MLLIKLNELHIRYILGYWLVIIEYFFDHRLQANYDTATSHKLAFMFHQNASIQLIIFTSINAQPMEMIIDILIYVLKLTNFFETRIIVNFFVVVNDLKSILIIW